MSLRKIGLIGGMSFESTAIYYRKINEAINHELGELASAEILLDSVNFQDIVSMQKSNRWEDAGKRLAQAASNLKAGGAECVMICAVTMHLVAEAVSQATDLPFIHIVDETAKHLIRSDVRKPLLIATRYTMESDFYPKRMKWHNIDVIVPDSDDRNRIHNIIFDELSAGKVLQDSRITLVSIIEKAKVQGADSVIFGCTEICLILETDKLPLPGFDSLAIHVDSAVRFALNK
ncbi:aspartate racemase [Pokkaliibacter plantistimulans]|uniref:Aspartate racemase n=1 Tax=Proteobacteria bacterium 228 TaxID=2083153 RepID=A0A2S5KXE7_9PROT|nr:aspartate/glutamate racemase family protein [Pokkaliibacter plantistimulans]PPC79385.1 aspartate racemase [Pokkaliibacter plantistimulans]